MEINVLQDARRQGIARELLIFQKNCLLRQILALSRSMHTLLIKVSIRSGLLGGMKKTVLYKNLPRETG